MCGSTHRGESLRENNRRWGFGEDSTALRCCDPLTIIEPTQLEGGGTQFGWLSRSHWSSAMLQREVQLGAQMSQKGFAANNNLRGRGVYSDFSVFYVFAVIFVFVFFFRCKMSKYAIGCRQSQSMPVKFSSADDTFWLLNPGSQY